MKYTRAEIELPPLDDLFSTQEMRDDALREKIQTIPLQDLYPFQNHPFKVQDNAELQKMAESIRIYGVLTPAVARPRAEGGYELISGHRRHRACQLLGIAEMPVIVREMTDDKAIISMVDANLQRETILPSEKAFAYKMKRDALQHQGIASPQVGERLLTVQKIGEAGGDSKNQVLRYIRLTFLIPPLLEKVDAGNIAFSPAVELSFLSAAQQTVLLDAMQQSDHTPSLAQAIRLKKLALSQSLSENDIYTILAENKPNQREPLRFPREELQKYFPKNYTEQQMRQDVFRGLELLKRQRERAKNQDAR